MNELMVESKKRNSDLKYGKDKVLSVSGEFGIVNQVKHLGRSYAGESVHNYHVVDVGDVVYTKSPLKANPYGIIKVNKGESGIVSTLYAVYKVKGESADGSFLDYYFSLDENVNRYLRPLVKKGAKNDMKINNAYVLHDKIYVTSIAEQRQIASFFSIIDTYINELKKAKSLLEQYKKGVVQKIFSQEMRFKNREGEKFSKWEEKPLGELFNEMTERNEDNNFELLSVTLKGGVCKQGTSAKRDSSSADKSNYKVVRVGEIAYNTMRMWQGASGISKLEGIISPAYTVVALKRGDVNFYGYLLKHPRVLFDFYRYSQGMTSDTWNLKFKHFSEVIVSVPTDLDEQKLIANFIGSIDDLIQAKEEQINLAGQWRKGLLQEMFI